MRRSRVSKTSTSAIGCIALGLMFCAPLQAREAATVSAVLPQRLAAHDASREVQRQIDTLRGRGVSEAQKLNDQALANALANARARLEQSELELNELTERQNAQRQTRAGLVPLLEQMLDLLAQSIERDLPFETTTRQHRVAAARAALSDASLSATQRFERVLEVYKHELQLNHTTQVSSAIQDTPGGPRAVTLIRVGRIALYTLTDDRSECSVFARATQRFESLALGDCRRLGAVLERPEQIALDGLPLSVPLPP